MSNFMEKMRNAQQSNVGKAIATKKGVLLTLEKEKLNQEKLKQGWLTVFIGQNQDGKNYVSQLETKTILDKDKKKASKPMKDGLTICGNATETEKGIICSIDTSKFNREYLKESKENIVLFVATNANGNLYVSHMSPKIEDEPAATNSRGSSRMDENEAAPW